MNIIGHAAKKSVLEKLEKKIKEHSFIQLITGEAPVPHQEIIKAILNADIGLISYKTNKSTENCMPTKLYEYLAYQLPYIICQNKTWAEITTQHQAGIIVNYADVDAKEIMSQLKNISFYSNLIPEDIYWETEEKKLTQLIDQLI